MRAGMSYFHEAIWKGIPKFLRLDGNPRVTPEVRRDVCLLTRMMAANLYYFQIEDLMFEVIYRRLQWETVMKRNQLRQPSSPATVDQAYQTNQANIHVYPDWAAMQTIITAIMWGPPQHMMPPYGPSYAAIYPPRGVYAHPAVPIGPHSHSQGIPASPAVSCNFL